MAGKLLLLLLVYGSGPLSKRQLKQFLDGLSPSVLRKIQAVAQRRAIPQDKVIKEALALYESVSEGATYSDEQLATLEKNPIVKAYLRFRAKKTSSDLGEKGRADRATKGGEKRWEGVPADQRKAHIEKMNEAREKARKKKAVERVSSAAPGASNPPKRLK